MMIGSCCSRLRTPPQRPDVNAARRAPTLTSASELYGFNAMEGISMRLAVLLTALAMPAIAWLSNRRAFGPTNGEVSDRYPTLLIAAGWAFSLWGLIFLLDFAYALWQWRRHTGAGVRARTPVGGGRLRTDGSVDARVLTVVVRAGACSDLGSLGLHVGRCSGGGARSVARTNTRTVGATAVVDACRLAIPGDIP